ncbi:glycosyl hydrolase family 18 [Pyrenophora tritici-repentis]|nr:glycosyl hydrolase family 18 [Pyrenophora tritici-repentis]
MRFFSTALLALATLATTASARLVVYADEWHPTRPTEPQVRAGVDHVVVAFAMANATAGFQPKVPISTLRSEFPGAKMMMAVGGWGDDVGFAQVSSSDAAIQTFAADVAAMLKNTGADGVDIDWEYPGGNGANYKKVPNSDKLYQITAFPKVLEAIRTAIGDKLLSIAVPGKSEDMIAYTSTTGPLIWPSVDYINVMSYDLMNRRDSVTQHHTSVAESEQTIKNYLAIGAPPQKINLGFAYYAKYFTTQGDCSAHPLGCPIALAEDPVTGKDLLTSGAYTFEPAHMEPVNLSSITISYDGTCGPEKNTKCATGCCSQYGNCGTSPEHCSGGCQHAFGTGCTDADVAGSWQRAVKNGVTDQQAGGQYYFDAENRLFWTWDTPDLISRKFEDIVKKYRLGGVMAWSLGEDSAGWTHLTRMAQEVAKLQRTTGNLPSGVTPDSTMTGNTPQETGLRYSSPPSGSTSSEGPSTAAQSSDGPYSIVWVDGTPNGPAGDYVTTPGSPPDCNGDEPVDVQPEDVGLSSTTTALVMTNTMAIAVSFEVAIPTTTIIQSPALEIISIAISTPTAVTTQPSPNSPFDATFKPDPGYVNPNWPVKESSVPAPNGQQPGAAAASSQYLEPTTSQSLEPFASQSLEPTTSQSTSNSTAQPHRAPYSSQPMQPVGAPPRVVVAAASSSSVTTVPEALETAAYTGGSCRLRWRKKAYDV